VALYTVDGKEINTFSVFQETDGTRKKPDDTGNADKAKPEKADKEKPDKADKANDKADKESKDNGQKDKDEKTTGKPDKTSGKTYGVNVAAGTYDDAVFIVAGMASKGSLVQVYTVDGTLQAEFDPFSSKKGVELATGDLDKDGNDEILVGDAGGTEIAVYQLDGTEVSRFQGLDQKNIASLAFGKGRVETPNLLPEETTLEDAVTGNEPSTADTVENPVTEDELSDADGEDTTEETPQQPENETSVEIANPTQTVENEVVDDVTAVESPDSEEDSVVDEPVDEVAEIPDTTEEIADVEIQPVVTEEPETVPPLPPLLEPVCTEEDKDIEKFCDYEGQTLTNVFVAEKSSISNVVLEGENVSEGWISNVTISSGATLTGGTLTGFVTNHGSIADVYFRGAELSGGLLAGTIQSKGTIKDVELAPDTHIIGIDKLSELGGVIRGNPAGETLIENVTILKGTELENVIFGESVTFKQ
jgi:hypothetical protein